MSSFTTIRFFLQGTSLSKLEAEKKARKALEEDNKRQVESIRAELAQLRAAAGTGSREAVLKVLTESEQRVEADMAETKRFSNHTHDYTKTKMTTSDFDQALIDGWEIVLQSPDGYVLLRKSKASYEDNSNEGLTVK